MKSKSLCLAGPTSSGKTALSLWLAKRLGLEIINADSLQIYEDLPLLTARPRPEETKEVSHHLFGFLKPEVPFSVGKWYETVASLFIQNKNLCQNALFVGGTGLYFKVLSEGLAKAPPVDQAVRARLNDLYAQEGQEGLEALWRREGLVDPCPLDPQRTKRALEVYMTTGSPLSHWQAQEKSPPLLIKDACVRIVLMPKKEELIMRASKRLEEAFRQSIPEMKALAERYQNLEEYPLMQALGVKELRAYCQGSLSFDGALAQAQIKTRQYIKRQMTWFRHQMSEAVIIDTLDRGAQQKILEEILLKNF
ncbi:MAG: tRNA (adenosine(37)-N6)-dimethylallyltransferase MiaA [Alphaproteobacteria bacterium]|nr:tRNA (adenosine(37)-N6)-dimethylallyltransferase MiaA [Alphaproteobacteria bacterium]